MSLGRTAIMVGLAYLATGAIYLTRCLTDTNPLRVPFFVIQYRNGGSAIRLVPVLIVWILAATINGQLAYWLIFGILASIGLCL
jgi:hypothetical protein